VFITVHISIFDASNITYLKELLLDENGCLRVVPYSRLMNVPQEHLSQFCMEHGIYAIPKQELIDFLREEISGNEESTIEIGSGNGVICKALGIRGTDNYMQEIPEIKLHYQMLGQATVPYGKHVERLDALKAVQKYKPDIVVAAWVTHKYNPREPWREGNMYGIDEKKLLDKVQKYIVVGNEKVHDKKPILSLPHRKVKAPWILSRSMNPEKNVIFIWEKP
jgi:hypothetical protein